MTEFELWEADYVYQKLLKRVCKEIIIDRIEDARLIAKELAKGWCVDEEPEGHLLPNGSELWIGDCDFGIMIKKAKEKEKE